MPGKLGMVTAHRKSVLRNMASSLLWYGKIETTQARAKQLKSYVDKILTLAINSYEDVIETEVTKTVVEGKGKKAVEKEVTKKVIKDGPKKLVARRKIMTMVNNLQEVKADGESKAEFKKRANAVKYPLIEKIFDEYAPKYAARKEEKGQGGYTRIYKLGARRGDAAEVAIIELVD
jgi:large subunit ribosomal protein L17